MLLICGNRRFKLLGISREYQIRKINKFDLQATHNHTTPWDMLHTDRKTLLSTVGGKHRCAWKIILLVNLAVQCQTTPLITRQNDNVTLKDNKDTIVLVQSNNEVYTNAILDSNSKNDMNNPQYGGPPHNIDDIDYDLDGLVIVYSIGSMIIVYLLVCLCYYCLKSIVNTIYNMRNQRRISLNDSNLENGNGLNGSDYSETIDSNSFNYPYIMHPGNNNNNMSNGNIPYKDELKQKKKSQYPWYTYLDNIRDIQSQVHKLTPEEQFYYRQGEEYLKQHPPFIISNEETFFLNNNSNDSTGNIDIVDPILNEQTRQFIEEEGASAWKFQPNANLPTNTVKVENNTELTFMNYNYDASVMTNLPIPCFNRIHYAEFKIFEWTNGNTSINDTQNDLTRDINNDNRRSTTNTNNRNLISFGLATSSYPYFRLPGRHHHSISYDSNGSRRVNNSFELEEDLINCFPALQQGDVVGVGYRVKSGTIFFTRNGKKVSEKEIGGHIRGWKFKYLYPIVGANVPCKIHVNLGSYGFVFIEANVKKWGYGKISGMKLPPPAYGQYDRDALLESGYEDNEDGSDDENIIDFNENNDETESLLDHLGLSRQQQQQHQLTLRDQNGHLLPPPPGFEFSTSPSNSRINEDIVLDFLPPEPPLYVTDTDSIDSNWKRGKEHNLHNLQLVGNSQRSPLSNHTNANNSSMRDFSENTYLSARSTYDEPTADIEEGLDDTDDENEFEVSANELQRLTQTDTH